jgi:hypothetical protein
MIYEKKNAHKIRFVPKIINQAILFWQTTLLGTQHSVPAAARLHAHFFLNYTYPHEIDLAYKELTWHLKRNSHAIVSNFQPRSNLATCELVGPS